MGPRLLTSIMGSILLLAVSLTAQADEPRLVSVSGEAVVKVTPDRLVV